MKFYTVLLPLIAALAMSPAFAEEKSMSGPDMSPADISQDAKSMKDMKGMKDMTSMKDMKKMHKHCKEEGKNGEAANKEAHKMCMEDMHKHCMEEGNKDRAMSKDMQDMHKNCVKQMAENERGQATTDKSDKKTMPKHRHHHHDTPPAQ